MNRPKPDWRGKTKHPQGELGPKPEPNGRIVATQPARTVVVIAAEIQRATVPALRPEDV